MILVIDDSAEILTWLRDVIQAAGYYFDEANNGTLALYKLERIYYSLVLVDIVLPDFNGTDLATKIKALPEPFCHTPLVAMTGGGSVDDDAGIFRAVLRKPFLPRDLRDTIACCARPPIKDLHFGAGSPPRISDQLPNEEYPS